MASPDRHLSLWETAKSELRNTFSRSDFETWISTLQAVGIVDGNILVLEAPTVLTEAWVNSNYGEVLRRQLTLVAGSNMDYRLSASTTAPRDPQPAAPAPRSAVRTPSASPAPAIKATNTFENFIVGPENEMAHGAALAVAKEPGHFYNPLFIHGPTGLGKTHLMHAIAHSVYAANPAARIAILRKKAAARGLDLSPEIAEFIASRIARNVRNLEGAVTRIVGLTGMTRKPLELAQVEKLLHDILVEEASHTLTAEVIQRKVAEHYRIQMSDMTSKRRMQNIAFPRQVAMYLATQLTGMSLVSIGQAFGGRDHGTVIHARKTVTNQMEVDTNVRRTVEYLRAQLSTNR